MVLETALHLPRNPAHSSFDVWEVMQWNPLCNMKAMEMYRKYMESIQISLSVQSWKSTSVREYKIDFYIIKSGKTWDGIKMIILR